MHRCESDERGTIHSVECQGSLSSVERIRVTLVYLASDSPKRPEMECQLFELLDAKFEAINCHKYKIIT